MMKSRYMYLLTLLMLGLLAGMVQAQDSNREEVKASLARDGWYVIYGANINDGDYGKFIVAVGASVACECLEPLEVFFDNQLDEQVTALQQNAPTVLKDSLVNILVNSFNGGGIQSINNIQVEGGLATYNRWETIIYHEPRTRSCTWEEGPKWARIKVNGFCTYTEEVEKHIPLPNTFQPYIRYRFVQS